MKAAIVLRCESCGAPLEAAKCDYCGSMSILGATDLYSPDPIFVPCGAVLDYDRSPAGVYTVLAMDAFVGPVPGY